ELHGPLRLRADRGRGDDVAPLAGAQGRRVRPAHRRADGAGNSARQAAPGRIRVLAPCGARARGHPTDRETGSAGGGGVKLTLSLVMGRAATAAGPIRIRVTPERADAPRVKARADFA